MKTVDPVRDVKIIMDELRKKDLEIMVDIKGHMRVFKEERKEWLKNFLIFRENTRQI